MANLAVFASGTGTNFCAIADRIATTAHQVVCLLGDVPDAPVLQRAAERGIPAHCISYRARPREDAELELLAHVNRYNTDLIALAGFMRLLTPQFLDAFSGQVINVHPSLLPRYPGIGAIEKSIESSDTELGITIHEVDYGLDTGPVLLQRSFDRNGGDSPAVLAERIHHLEHRWYPEVIIGLLDALPRKDS
ncbi:MAG: phosphoribosylglycinamide formyltransferase [Spirochaetaceae bacterium]|nr:MAG: phosphoribosylglycinamide formyltransferase [Spirochaetaceae bacterium]